MAKPPPTFASLEGLLEHGRRDGFDIRPTLLRVLTDLYLQKRTHPLEDERYYTELALRLINSTEMPARAAVAERLAPYSSAPRQVIMRLARDVIEVAGPILKHSPCLTPADLAAIGADCGPAHAAIIAARSAALPAAADQLGAHQVVIARVPGADQQAVELSELFFSAGAAERRLILLNLEYAPVEQIQATAAQAGEVVRRLEAAALQHNTDAFARELESALGVSHRMARRIVNDELGEPIVAASKALQAPRAVLERILLFINPRIGQSVQRVYELATRFDEISFEAARRLVAIWRDADPREPTPQQAPHRPGARRPSLDLARAQSPSFARRPLDQRDARLRGSGNER
jgi:uncharacterized protein (DUF2336 family)